MKRILIAILIAAGLAAGAGAAVAADHGTSGIAATHYYGHQPG